jgi:mRNA interferase HigB
VKLSGCYYQKDQTSHFGNLKSKYYVMRIFTKGTLRDFWEKYPDAEPSLKTWYEVNEERTFANPNEVIALFKGSDIVGNGRIVFNICRNKYRLIAKYEYEKKLVFVRFLGTHKEYDAIDDIKFI